MEAGAGWGAARLQGSHRQEPAKQRRRNPRLVGSAADADAAARVAQDQAGPLSIAHHDLARVKDAPNTRTVMTIRESRRIAELWRPPGAAHRSGYRPDPQADSSRRSGDREFAAADPNLRAPGAPNPRFRRCVITAPGRLLVACDWSMIELRALAWIYQDDALMTDLVEHDIHARTAARVNEIAVDSSPRASVPPPSGQFRRDLRHHRGWVAAERLRRFRGRADRAAGAARDRPVRHGLSPCVERSRTLRQSLSGPRLHRRADLRRIVCRQWFP